MEKENEREFGCSIHCSWWMKSFKMISRKNEVKVGHAYGNVFCVNVKPFSFNTRKKKTNNNPKRRKKFRLQFLFYTLFFINFFLFCDFLIGKNLKGKKLKK